MKRRNEQQKGSAAARPWSNLGRRALLKIAGAASVGLPLAAYLGDRAPWRGIRAANAETGPRNRETYWQPEGHFVQSTVDVTDVDAGIVRARVDGEWREFVNRELSQDFIDWNFGSRLALLEDPMGMGQCLDGPHSGCLATYGANRGDSVFSLNAAFKGFGFYPTEENIDDALATVLDNWDASIMAKLGILQDLYSDQSLWDFRLLSSLELYTTQDFETHSFLNQMANPVATINWLAIPGSFEVRAIARLMHPQDPGLSELDAKRALWVNAMHDFYHGSGPAPDPADLPYIACIYYAVEVFDNSPYPGPMGVRSMPAL
jgi:hypothetical protein